MYRARDGDSDGYRERVGNTRFLSFPLLSILPAMKKPCLLFFLLFFAFKAQADTGHEAHMYGDMKKLFHVVHSTLARDCSDSSCEFKLTPLRLTIDTAGQNGIQVVWDRVVQPRNTVVTKQGRDGKLGTEAPLLLKGTGSFRSGSSDRRRRTFPVSGAIHVRKSRLPIEIFIPRKAFRDSVPDRLMRLRFNGYKLQEEYRLEGTAEFTSSSAFSETQCATARSANSTGSYTIAPLTSQQTSPYNVKELFVATDTDKEFDSIIGEDPFGSMLALVNAASVFYEAQLGAKLTVIRQRTASDGRSATPPPYLSATSDTLLDQFQDHVLDTNRLGAADEYILFTGKSMIGNVIGISFTGATCVERDYSFMLNRYINPTVTPMIIAHELGHGLGSPHFDRVLEIMNTSLGKQLPTTFSSDSQDVITTHLNRYHSTGCLGSVVPSSTPTPLPTATPTIAPVQISENSPVPDPDAPAPRSLRISSALTKKGELSFTFTKTVPLTECSLELKTGKTRNSSMADSARVLKSFPMSESTLSFSIALPYGIALENGEEALHQRYIFYSGSLVCDGKVMERSGPTKTDTGKIQGRKISRGRYIQKLESALAGIS